VSAAILVAQPTGQINGSIQSETHAPLSKVTVSALIRPDAKNSDPKPFSTAATTAADGTFTPTGLPAGTFVICAQLPGSDFLNPCQWSSASPKAVVNGGQTVNLPVIQLRKGAHFHVRLNDDDGALTTNHAKTPGADLLIGIWSPSGQFVGLPGLTKDASGWELDLAVPYDTPLPFHLNSKFFSLAAEGGLSSMRCKVLEQRSRYGRHYRATTCLSRQESRHMTYSTVPEAVARRIRRGPHLTVTDNQSSASSLLPSMPKIWFTKAASATMTLYQGISVSLSPATVSARASSKRRVF
jgi:hypothetical protein